MIGKTVGGVALVCLLLVACASNRAMNNKTAAVTRGGVTEEVEDSVRTLIRRGMTTEALEVIRLSPDLDQLSREVLSAEAIEKSCHNLNTDSTMSLAARYGTAAIAWGFAARTAPDSTRFVVRYFSTVARAVKEDSTLNPLPILVENSQQYADSLATGTSLQDLYLAYMRAAIFGDTSVTERADRLIELYPESDEANDLIGSRFWDGMYPIWTNDSAKVPYFHDFIQKYSSSDWAQYARRNLIASYFALKDTVSAVSETHVMVHFAGDNPLVLAQGVAALMDVVGQEDTVKVWAERAYALRDKLSRPSYYSPPEWALVEQATRAGFPLTLAGLALKEAVAPASPPVDPIHPAAEGAATDSLLALARRYAEESLSLAVYDIDDNNTPAPQYLMLGRIALAEGDSTEAAEWWVECAKEGDVYNRFAGKAVDSLKAMIRFNTENTENTESTEREVLEFCRKVANYKGMTFDRVTKEVGLDSARGSRVAWGGDYLLAGGTSLFVKGSGATNDKIYFYNLTSWVELKSDGAHGGIWGDYDSDGDLDLFCFSSASSIARSEKLLRYSSQSEEIMLLPEDPFDSRAAPLPKFYDVTPNSPSLPDSFSTEAAIWFDANGDGRLDLYIPGYERPAKGADDLGNAWPSRLMVQTPPYPPLQLAGGERSAVFHDSTEAFGLVPKDGRWFCARSPVACDFDRDGDQDLYVGNYRLQENQFWVNNSRSSVAPPRATETKTANDRASAEELAPSRFSNLAARYEVDGEEKDGWYGHTIGCEWGDFDGDGDFDLIACNLAHPRYIGFSNRTMLYRNDAVASTIVDATGKETPFKNVQREWGIKYEECHSEPVWGDFDNDGDLDLFITCVYPNRRSFLYENKGDHFEDVTFLSGVRMFNGWGCATSDYDNDGRLDLAVCEGGKVELFRNTTKEVGNWIEIAPDRTPGEHLAQIGGIVEIESGGRKFIRQFEGGKGAGSQNSGTLHFGIGKGTVCQMTVSNRAKSIHFSDLRANQKFEIGKESVGVGVH